MGARSTIWMKPARRDVADSSRPVPACGAWTATTVRVRARAVWYGETTMTASRCRSTCRRSRPTSSSVRSQRRPRAARRVARAWPAAGSRRRGRGPTPRPAPPGAGSGSRSGNARSTASMSSTWPYGARRARGAARPVTRPGTRPVWSISVSAASRCSTGPGHRRLVGVGDDEPADAGAGERGAQRADLGVVGRRVVLRGELRPAERADVRGPRSSAGAGPEHRARVGARVPLGRARGSMRRVVGLARPTDRRRRTPCSRRRAACGCAPCGSRGRRRALWRSRRVRFGGSGAAEVDPRGRRQADDQHAAGAVEALGGPEASPRRAVAAAIVANVAAARNVSATARRRCTMERRSCHPPGRAARDPSDPPAVGQNGPPPSRGHW